MLSETKLKVVAKDIDQLPGTAKLNTEIYIILCTSIFLTEHSSQP